MTQYRILKYTHVFSVDKLMRKVEDRLQELEEEGYTIISVSFGTSSFSIPTAFVTVREPDTDMV